MYAISNSATSFIVEKEINGFCAAVCLYKRACSVVIFHPLVVERKGLPVEKMVKIVEVEEQHDAGPDDDCCEISLEEFAKKVSLKEDDDVILIASKGKVSPIKSFAPFLFY